MLINNSKKKLNLGYSEASEQALQSSELEKTMEKQWNA